MGNPIDIGPKSLQAEYLSSTSKFMVLQKLSLLVLQQ